MEQTKGVNLQVFFFFPNPVIYVLKNVSVHQYTRKILMKVNDAGHLSDRMLIPNNPWTTTWSSAQPVPAHRQKRLFDDTREAEKTLHFLNSKNIGEVAQLLLPTLTHAALYTLRQQKQDALPHLPDVTLSILNKLQYATKPIHQKLHIYEVSLNLIPINL